MPTYGSDAGRIVTPHVDQTGMADPDPDPWGPTGSKTRELRVEHPSWGAHTWPLRADAHPESDVNAMVETSRGRAERGTSPGHDIVLPKEGKK